jgi:hypothetical protein
VCDRYYLIILIKMLCNLAVEIEDVAIFETIKHVATLLAIAN